MGVLSDGANNLSHIVVTMCQLLVRMDKLIRVNKMRAARSDVLVMESCVFEANYYWRSRIFQLGCG